MLYHANSKWLPGGYLGVEVFFVISGYLITSLLLAERRTSGTTGLLLFWRRRARRLLPALFALLIAVSVYSVIFLPMEVALLREPLIAAFTYVSNWYLIFNNESYFELFGRPSLLRHLWSLAVEEQFYVLWPIAFTLLFGKLRGRYAVPLLVGGAVSSAALMAAVYDPSGDASRVYYGTDTRLSGLLIGSALAYAMKPGAAQVATGRWWESAIAVLPFAAMGVLFATLADNEAFLYRGGFLMTDVVTALVIFVSVRMATTLPSRVAGSKPLVWLGLRSYAIYLWHWPVFMLTRPGLDFDLSTLEMMPIRFAITLGLACVSYALIERPLRTGGLLRVWRALLPKRPVKFPALHPRPLAFLATSMMGVVVLAFSVAAAEPPGPPSYLAAGHVQISSWSQEREPAPTSVPSAHRIAQAHTPVSDEVEAFVASPSKPNPSPGATPGAAAAPVLAIDPPASMPSAPPTPALTPLPVPPTRIFAIGDSVMLSASPSLGDLVPNIEVDAAVSRQVEAGIEVLRARRDSGTLGDVVVVHLGTNGDFEPEEFDEIMAVTEGVQRVVFLNLKVPRDWEGYNNQVIAEGVARHPNAVLIDWHNVSTAHPEYFYEDDIHLERPGGDAYAGLIAAASQ